MRHLTTVLSLVSLVLAAPVALVKRDVWAPKILSPHAGDVWRVGGFVTISWDTTNPPAQITNERGTIFLRNSTGYFVDDLGGTQKPLASGFNLHEGSIEIQVPQVPAGHAYSIVLMGDSGNASEDFVIAGTIPPLGGNLLQGGLQ